MKIPDHNLTRRGFLGGVAVSSIATNDLRAAKKTLPTRTLGRTGEKPSIIAMGGGNQFYEAYSTEELAAEAVNLALDSGVTYIDSAQNYGKGLSETLFGYVIKHRRKEVFLATKVIKRDYDEALRECELSLKRLQTDKLDLIHIHNMGGMDDLVAAEKGSLRVVQRLKSERVARFIGITSHTYPEVISTALERHDFDCVQVVLNAALIGSGEGEKVSADQSFERVVIPMAKKKGIGVIAMKCAGKGVLIGAPPAKASFPELLRYTMSLPVDVVSVGMPSLDKIRNTCDLARTFKPMSKEEMTELSQRMSAANRVALSRYYLNHEDA